MTDTLTRCTIAGISPFSLDRLTFREIEQEIRRLPALVLPLGGCEPTCENAPMGISSRCACAVAAEVSARYKMLLAPLLSYGCSVPLSSFGGCSGIKGRTFTNTLCETMTAWSRQGIRLFVLIDGLVFNGPALDAAAGRIKNSRPGTGVLCMALQRDGSVLEFAGKRFKTGMPALPAAVMLSLAAHLDPGLIRAAEEKPSRAQPSAEAFRTWAKRGMDPQRFRKLYPDGPATLSPDAGSGRQLFEFILQLIDAQLAPLIDSLRPESSAQV